MALLSWALWSTTAVKKPKGPGLGRMMTMSELAQKRTRWEIITLGCMFIGYTGFILSRTVLAVVSPEMGLGPPHFQADVCLP